MECENPAERKKVCLALPEQHLTSENRTVREGYSH